MRPINYYRRSSVICLSVCPSVTIVSPAKTAEPIAIPLGCESSGPNEPCRLLDGVHIGATWRIRLNRPCAAAMRPYVKLLVAVTVTHSSANPRSDLRCCFVVDVAIGRVTSLRDAWRWYDSVACSPLHADNYVTHIITLFMFFIRRINTNISRSVM